MILRMYVCVYSQQLKIYRICQMNDTVDWSVSFSNICTTSLSLSFDFLENIFLFFVQKETEVYPSPKKISFQFDICSRRTKVRSETHKIFKTNLVVEKSTPSLLTAPPLSFFLIK